MGLNITVAQRNVLSQKMILSGQILQMTSSQLEEYLNDQSLENPVLDLIEKPRQDFLQQGIKKHHWLQEHTFHNPGSHPSADPDGDDPASWNVSQEVPVSLHDHLWAQLLTGNIRSEEEPAWHYLLDCLDDRGYFTESLEAFAHRFRLTHMQAQNMLLTLQELSPAGIGARSLEECLCIQLEQQGILTDNLRSFVEHHLADMAKNHLPVIARSLKISLSEVKCYCDVIRKLDPKPGIGFSCSQQIPYIEPDIVIAFHDGDFDILLNESTYPEVSINSGYYNMYQQYQDEEVRTYLAKKIRQVEWIQQCIAQRSQTILKVTGAILFRQEDFFRHGPSHIKPLRLVDIAEDIQMHESTISRAIRDKYLQCSFGIFPLSFFFPKAAPEKQTGLYRTSASNTEATVQDVKQALKSLIQEENRRKPYSDQIISEMLTKQGFPISRRTAAKYRDEAGIPGMSGRKAY